MVPYMLALVQKRQHYLIDGGSVEAWQARLQIGPTRLATKARCLECQHVQPVLAGEETFVCVECGTNLRLKAPAKRS